MAKRSATEKARKKVAGAAKTGADTVRDIAGEAIRAAAVAAAGVALHRTAEACAAGQLRRSQPRPSWRSPPAPGQIRQAAKDARRGEKGGGKIGEEKIGKEKECVATAFVAIA